MEKSEIHNGWKIREKGEEKGDIPQKNTTQIGSKSRRKRVRAIARTKGEGEVQRNKKRKMDRGGSLNIKAQITKKQQETQRMCKRTHHSIHAAWQGHTKRRHYALNAARNPKGHQ